MQAHEVTHRERMTLAVICINVCAIHSLGKTQKGEEKPEKDRKMQRTARTRKRDRQGKPEGNMKG